LADLWLEHALSCLLDVCEVPLAERRGLVALATAPSPLSSAMQDDAQARLDRLDRCRVAVLFGALAVEARLDRLLRHSDATDWPAIAHLAPAERFRLARRLIDGGSEPEDSELYFLAVDLFELRDELVDAVGRPGAALEDMSPEFSSARTRAMVVASARICEFLKRLAGEAQGATEELVQRAGEALTQRADAVAGVLPSAAPEPTWEWNRNADFSPGVVGS
jgi:hypothetical protein